jgi:hypothetical protein
MNSIIDLLLCYVWNFKIRTNVMKRLAKNTLFITPQYVQKIAVTNLSDQEEELLLVLE